MLTMNEKDKNEMLEAILNENEAYQCKLWAVIMAGADTYALIGGLSTLTGGAAAALGALSNAYCYNSDFIGKRRRWRNENFQEKQF